MIRYFLCLLFFVNIYAFDTEDMYSLKDVILQKQNSYYTIVLATVVPSLNYKKIIEENKIDYNAVAYRFGQKDKYVKVIFGAFKSYEEAFKSLTKLNSSLLKNRPYIEKTDKHIRLFHKYNNKL